MVREGLVALNEFMDIGSALAMATERLRAGSDSARLDAELLLSRALDVNRSYFFAHPEDMLDPDAGRRFLSLVERRASGEPMSYITGEREFWSMNLMVSPATLVPRPETELLVERALMLIGRKAAMRILDLGTGSGAIALAIARERPLCEVVATDLSEDALAIARQNARQLDVPNVAFACGDWVDPVKGQRFDLIVSNPPYVAEADETLALLRHEPRSALCAGNDGLDAIRRIAQTAGEVLADDGRLLLEHGSMQREAVAAELQRTGWSQVECFNDHGGLPRVTVARKATADAHPPAIGR
ncbi:MAG: peptide chain release factor N(5)-glutamine methyltransferase [Woeseiaceae bacterium]|nr:peptide chain release factor N(5)-glutamine methyltransferase [Woeseiaceae bacterium]